MGFLIYVYGIVFFSLFSIYLPKHLSRVMFICTELKDIIKLFCPCLVYKLLLLIKDVD